MIPVNVDKATFCFSTDKDKKRAIDFFGDNNETDLLNTFNVEDFKIIFSSSKDTIFHFNNSKNTIQYIMNEYNKEN